MKRKHLWYYQEVRHQNYMLKDKKKYDPPQDLLLQISSVISKIKKNINRTPNILLLSDRKIYSYVKKDTGLSVKYIENNDSHKLFTQLDSSQKSDLLFDLVIGIGTQEVLQSKLNVENYRAIINQFYQISESVIWLVPVTDPNNINSWALSKDYGRDFIELWNFVSDLGIFKSHIRNSYSPLVVFSKKYLFLGNKLLVNNKNTKIIYKSNNDYYGLVVKFKKKIIKINLVQDLEKSKLLNNEFVFLKKLSFVTKIRLRLPIQIGFFSGSYVNHLTRKHIKGKVLTEVKEVKSIDSLLFNFLDLCRRFAGNHLFLNDLRPWNIVWNGKKCYFIDFENASEFDNDNSTYPQIVYFFAVAHFISHKLDSSFWSPDKVIDFLNTQTSFRTEPEVYYSDMWLKLPNYPTELSRINFNDINVGFTELMDLLGAK